MQWYHEGAAKKIVKMKGKNAAEKLIEMKLHDAGDEDPKQFQNKYALRISSWFGAYHRAVTKSHERTERVGRVEETAEALLMLDAATAKKPKGPPRKKSKAAGASGSDVPAGPAAATTAVAVIGADRGSRSQSLRTEMLLVRWSCRRMRSLVPMAQTMA